MPRVLYVSTSTTVGGAEKTLFTLATLVDPKVATCIGVVSLKPKGEYARRLKEMGHSVVSLDLKKKPGLRDLQRLAGVIQEYQPDLVVAFMYQAIQLCRAVKRIGYAEFKLISSPRVHYRTRDDLSLMLDRWLKKADDLLVSESEASRTYLTGKMGYDEAKVRTIRNGTDVAGWTPSKADRVRVRKELSVADNEILIGSVGRLEEQKGHVYLLEAVAKLRAAHPVRCAIVGDGPMRGVLTERIRQLGLEGVVLIPGEQDIFCLPSLWEGLPNALLEAMALGLPVVATSVDGIPEAVASDISGLLCAPKDSQALFVPLQDLIADPALRKRLGSSAAKVVQENFTITGMVRAWEETIRRTLESSAA
ncbi:MAG: group 1 glycosyl transferase [Elusimicrobia bacterium]|nr:MAG: group 1 glycosyl transferase [Elusimicrobiota bacterium]